MSTTQNVESTSRKPLRLWPGVIAAIVVVLLRFVVPLAVPDATILGVLAAVAGSAVIVIWWVFFSRAPWSERIGAIVLMIVATLATKLVVHPSIAGGMRGMMLPLYAVPSTLGPALVAWAVATRRLSTGVRRATLVATILLACGVWTLARTDGIKGGAGAQLAWRWTPTAEERLLAQGNDDPLPPPAVTATPETATEASAMKPAGESASPPAAPAATKAPVNAAVAKESLPEKSDARKAGEDTPVPASLPSVPKMTVEWPGFRGRARDAVIRGVRIETDWSKSPPVQIWRRPIGPGWSSFAVGGGFAFTQEQRGQDEIVAAYRLTTGEPVWRHRDPVRFWESNGGAGPRGTPTLSNGRLYTFGATGIVNALDAATGAVVWSRNAATDTGAKLPGWGFASSPLVIDDVVVVAASGRLVAYEIATGNPRWRRQTQGGGYSSPQLMTLDGVPQIVLQSGGGAAGIAPADGALLWEHKWEDGASIVQPASAEGGDVLISGGNSMGGIGMRRIALRHGAGGWTVEERWTSRGLKPYFNDYVVHKGHAYGFDGSILACIDLADGQRKWKGGRYGSGQLVLLPDEDLLLVVSEEGELALVSAAADQFREIARFKAIEGKTWNHPALVRDVLLVRNGEEMAAFRLGVAGR